ncbi:NitT/TauT family transport system ATP-binding protein [Desulfobotulus alkaliphilus]|uniref:NitT/TauT family transport system ATP-binding protein n=1 Tax=Desulfobotulus alkaliphilus TaxID=622671 RepID=A0A562S698_9BACT|nr:ATP-binding cassette domain-containing protein [Desulfobotulus alkaliphilus]TWI76889.1 NitT/TauT family transport system ATP-binding protein [Desulfobotulus alkaliphilus]
MSMIRIHQLFFGYSGKPLLFENFSLTIPRGESWTLIGPSGCGKSTLLSLMAGLQKPRRGSIEIEGRPLQRPRPESGLVFQDHGLLPWATVADNVALGLNIRRYYGADGRHAPRGWEHDGEKQKKTVSRWIQRLGLEGKEALYPAQLSRGQRQRAAIARTMVMKPDLLLMDEPFSALDPPIREELQGLMIRLGRRESITRITVTHDIAEAVILGEKILVARAGTNHKPQILKNPVALEKDPRTHKDFNAMCKGVRQAMGGLQ